MTAETVRQDGLPSRREGTDEARQRIIYYDTTTETAQCPTSPTDRQRRQAWRIGDQDAGSQRTGSLSTTDGRQPDGRASVIHNNYLKLADHERKMVDDACEMFMSTAKAYAIPIAGDDRIEHVAEAMATCIVDCRK